MTLKRKKTFHQARRFVCLVRGHTPAQIEGEWIWYRTWCLRCGKPYEVRK